MKKVLKLLFVIAMVFVFIPKVYAIYATADIPVNIWFMVYPDGSEVGTESAAEANNPSEKLIYSGVTDQNGNINLCDWENTGTIRIVQHVPEGYTTNTREITLDVSKSGNANFIDYRGLSNPSTGRSLLVFLGIITAAGVTILVSKKNKKSLLVIPVIVGVALLTTVEAQADCRVVSVKDGTGKAISGVIIDIYAEPYLVEDAPGVKIDANGGHFFDGTTVMYVRLPSETCTGEEWRNSLSTDKLEHILLNMMMAYRDGYTPNETTNSSDGYMHDGDIYYMNWEQDSSSTTIEVKANGGYIDFYGTQLTDVYLYDDDRIRLILGKFKNGDKKIIGFDDNAACSHYNQYGLSTTQSPEVDWDSILRRIDYRQEDIAYACWNSKPDGIYVNDTVFIGTDDTCYNESRLYQEERDAFVLYNYEKGIYVGNINDNPVFSKLFPGKSIQVNDEVPEEEDITKIEIVKNGTTILTINQNELSYDSSEEVYLINNTQKKNTLTNYLQNLYSNNCLEATEPN